MANQKSSSFPSLSTILENAFEGAPEYFVVLDCALDIQMAGSAFREATGYESGSGASFLDTVERFSASKVRGILEELRKDATKREAIEVRHVLKDGSTVPVTGGFFALPP